MRRSKARPPLPYARVLGRVRRWPAMIIKVLGSAAGGGFPQANCNCRNCADVRRGVPGPAAAHAIVAGRQRRRPILGVAQRLARPAPADRRHAGAVACRAMRSAPAPSRPSCSPTAMSTMSPDCLVCARASPSRSTLRRACMRRWRPTPSSTCWMRAPLSAPSCRSTGRWSCKAGWRSKRSRWPARSRSILKARPIPRTATRWGSS